MRGLTKRAIGRATIALACVLASALVAGCGGGSHPDAAQVSALCAKTKAAQERSHTVLGELGINLTDKPLVEKALSGVEEYRAAAQQLEKALSGAHREGIEQLVSALSQQIGEITATLEKNQAAEKLYEKGLDNALNSGKLNLALVCG